jgi:hypothetical protein
MRNMEARLNALARHEEQRKLPALKIKNAWHQQEAGLVVPHINIINLPNYSAPRQYQPHTYTQPMAQTQTYIPRPATRGRGRGRSQRPNY